MYSPLWKVIDVVNTVDLDLVCSRRHNVFSLERVHCTSAGPECAGAKWLKEQSWDHTPSGL